LAAGNCCVVKPSEVSPNCSKVLTDIINSSFNEDYCKAVELDANGTGELLKERFDFILYTGSTKVGKIVAEAAAKYLTPTVLELGGKSPCIIDKTADLDLSVGSICWGKFINSGQTCTAPDYILVQKEVKGQLIENLKKQILSFYGEDAKSSPDYGRIINKKHFQRIQSLIREGTIVYGGETDESELYISPTIIDDVKWEHKIMKEEIFGPVLPVLTFEKIEDVVEILASKEKPLALYLYTTDSAVKQRIINNVQFGGGCVNATLMHMLNTNLPFGGTGNSGHGFYQGKWSIEIFSHKKSVLSTSSADSGSPLFPPYKDRVNILKQIYLGK
jgi:aldehyde dehydrogenase (NAD+)